MKFLKKMKDGGAESSVTGYWLIETKSLFSIVLLRFEGASRDAYHEHAFNSLSWLISGKLIEYFLPAFGIKNKIYKPSFLPFTTLRKTFHRVDSNGTSWVLSFRGPWTKTWKEYLPNENRFRTLISGRIEV